MIAINMTKRPDYWTEQMAGVVENALQDCKYINKTAGSIKFK
jgi:hypothetical protein